MYFRMMPHNGNIFELIESMERNRISSKPSSSFDSNSEDDDDEQFSRSYYNIEGVVRRRFSRQNKE